LTKGVGVGKGVFQATTMGDPTKNAILEVTITGAANGAGEHIFDKEEEVTPVATATFEGTFKFRFTENGTTTDWDGIVTKGKFRLAGKPIGNFLVQ
jgi:hypothetical protein